MILLRSCVEKVKVFDQELLNKGTQKIIGVLTKEVKVYGYKSIPEQKVHEIKMKKNGYDCIDFKEDLNIKYQMFCAEYLTCSYKRKGGSTDETN